MFVITIVDDNQLSESSEHLIIHSLNVWYAENCKLLLNTKQSECIQCNWVRRFTFSFIFREWHGKRLFLARLCIYVSVCTMPMNSKRSTVGIWWQKLIPFQVCYCFLFTKYYRRHLDCFTFHRTKFYAMFVVFSLLCRFNRLVVA